MSVINKDLGVVTAYAYAVEAGYTGTEEEFEQALGDLAELVTDFENFTVEVTTLEPGSSATASYANGVLSLGIPEGEKGDTGATPNLTIGTVTTLAPGSDATATITGTAEAPVLSLGIPEGDPGEVPAAALASDFSASVSYKKGDYVWKSGTLYEFTADHAAGAWTGSDATAAKVADDVANLKSAIDEVDVGLVDSNSHSVIVPHEIAIEWITGSYYDLTTGEVKTLASYSRTEKMPCTGGDTFKFDINSGQIIFFAEDGTVSYKSTGANAIVCRAAPEGTVAFALNNNNPNIRGSSMVHYAVSNSLINAHVIAPAILLCDSNAFSAGTYASTVNGAISTASTISNYYCLLHYPVKPNHKYRTQNQTQVVFYDASLTFLSSILPGGLAKNTNTRVEMDFTTPNNCAYICVNTLSAHEQLFDAEAYDIAGYIANLSKLTNRTVLLFGDSITGNYAFGDNIAYEVEKHCGAKTYNCGFGGCRMELLAGDSEAAQITNPFAMCSLVDELAKSDDDPTKWSAQDEAAALFEQSPRLNRIIKFRLGILKTVDITDVDIVTIAYGTNEIGYVQENQSNPYDKYTFGGATRYSIEKLLELNPKLRIVLLTPIYRHDVSGSGLDSDHYVSSHGLSMADNINTLKTVGLEYKTPVIDLYHDLGINADNYLAYFGDDDEPYDGTHINSFGRNVYGERLAGELSRLF